MKFEESPTLELKRQVVDSLQKTIIAFANTRGGTIYIGVDDDGTVVGVDCPDQEMLKITNMVRDAIKPDLVMFLSYSFEENNGKRIIRIEVQKGTRAPYYLRSKGLRPEGIFVRQGTSTVPAGENAIRQMIVESDGDSFEKIRSFEQDLTFQTATEEFKAREVAFGPSHFKTLSLVDDDGIYTNLGLLLSDQCQHTLKVAVFEGNTKSVFKDRREFGGSLFKQLDDAFAFLMQYNRIRSEYSGLRRIDIRDYPEVALRETLLNVVVHRDYALSASSLISIFDDRMEFVTVGGLVKGVNLSDLSLGISISRNERLAKVFYRLELIEAYGTGIPKILEAYEHLYQQPSFEATDNAFRTILPNQSELPGKRQLTSEEHRILQLVNRISPMQRTDVQDELNISQSKAGRILRSMVEKDLLERTGRGKNTAYLPKDRF